VDITLKLSIEEVQALMNLMGETPAKMGYFPLMAKMKAQADPQVAVEEVAEPEQAAA